VATDSFRVALVAGETSGDQLGAGLIQAIKRQVPNATFEGVAGPQMEAVGCKVFEPAESLAVMGLIEPLKEIPKLLKLRRELVGRWTQAPPDVFVGIDAPDFNLGLETRLKAVGISTVHYVSPSVWAWRQRRVKKIGLAADVVLCLLPFEKAFYDQHNIAAEFVGHPMADRLNRDVDQRAAKRSLGISAPLCVAALPGSRASEVSRLGPVFAEALAGLHQEHAELAFVAPMATPALRTLFESQLNAYGMSDNVQLTDGDADLAIQSADVVLLASGTASLQAALLEKPMVAAYKLAPLTYAIVKGLNLIKIPYFSLPNLLTPEPLVPEFLQSAANAPALAAAVTALLEDSPRRATIAAEFSRLKTSLAQNADRRAADVVLKVGNASRANLQ